MCRLNPSSVKNVNFSLNELERVDKVILYHLEPKLITDDEDVIRYRIGKNAFRKLAEDAHAVVFFGKTAEITSQNRFLKSKSARLKIQRVQFG